MADLNVAFWYPSSALSKALSKAFYADQKVEGGFVLACFIAY